MSFLLEFGAFVLVAIDFRLVDRRFGNASHQSGKGTNSERSAPAPDDAASSGEAPHLLEDESPALPSSARPAYRPTDVRDRQFLDLQRPW